MSTHSLAAKRFVADADRMAWHDRRSTPYAKNATG